MKTQKFTATQKKLILRQFNTFVDKEVASFKNKKRPKKIERPDTNSNTFRIAAVKACKPEKLTKIIISEIKKDVYHSFCDIFDALPATVKAESDYSTAVDKYNKDNAKFMADLESMKEAIEINRDALEMKLQFSEVDGSNAIELLEGFKTDTLKLIRNLTK